MKDTTVTEGVIAFNGVGAWGIVYNDGNSQCYGFTKLNEAMISNPEFCRKPEDKTYPNSHNVAKLKQSKLVKVRRTIITEIIEE